MSRGWFLTRTFATDVKRRRHGHRSCSMRRPVHYRRETGKGVELLSFEKHHRAAFARSWEALSNRFSETTRMTSITKDTVKPALTSLQSTFLGQPHGNANYCVQLKSTYVADGTTSCMPVGRWVAAGNNFNVFCAKCSLTLMFNTYSDFFADFPSSLLFLQL